MAALKALARDTCAEVLSLSRFTAPAQRLRGRLSIITFHRVLTEPQRRLYALPGLAVTPDELDAHLKFATRHFRCLSLSSALQRLATGTDSGRPLLAITFDDGQLDNFQNARPVLERNGVTASFFIPSRILEDTTPLWHDVMAGSVAELASRLGDESGSSGPSGRDTALELMAELTSNGLNAGSANRVTVEQALETTKQWSASKRNAWLLRSAAVCPRLAQRDWDGFMNVGQLKELIEHGHEIGSHSHSHPLLPQCTDEELVDEIAGSKARLESALGSPITSFCYPNGSTDQRSIAMVRSAGYSCAVTTQWGSNSPTEDIHRLQRFDMNAKNVQDRSGRFSEARLAWRMSGWYPGLNRTPQDSYGS